MNEHTDLITPDNVHNILNEISTDSQVEESVVKSLSIIMEDYLQDVLLNSYQLCRHRSSKVITPQDVWHYLEMTKTSPIEPLAGLGATMGLSSVISLICGGKANSDSSVTKTLEGSSQPVRSKCSFYRVLNKPGPTGTHRVLPTASARQRKILSSYFSDSDANKARNKHVKRSRPPPPQNTKNDKLNKEK